MAHKVCRLTGAFLVMVSSSYLKLAIMIWLNDIRLEMMVQFLQAAEVEQEAIVLEKTRTGRPAGSEEFIKALEHQIGRSLLPDKPGLRPN